MRHILLLSLLLLAIAPTHAQEPDEEYYPFQSDHEEEYLPMIATDSSLFYRAIQHIGDPFREATDFKFSFTAYRRRGERYISDRTDLNGIRLSGRYIPILRSLATEGRYRPTDFPIAAEPSAATFFRTDEAATAPFRHTSLHLSGRNYLIGMNFTAAEEFGRGWEGALTLQGRTGRDLHVKGLFGNTLNVGIRATKNFRYEHALSLIIAAPLSMRSMRTASTREAFTLTGNPRYNPSWGYQNGKIRSARIRRDAVALTALNYRARISPSTSLSATATAEAGLRRYSSLEWYDAQSPLPDNYRKLPDFLTSPSARLSLAEIWRSGDTRYTQIDWDELYRQNRLTRTGAAYAVADRVERQADIRFLGQGVTSVDERTTIRYEIRIARTDSRYYKQMRDLLGGRYIVDLDQYLIDDDTYNNKLQNDLRHPNRIIRRGDRFGYDYTIRRNELGAGCSVEYRSDRLRTFFTAYAEKHTLFRQGYYEKELFPGRRSLGKSRSLHFAPYLFGASLGYAFSPRHYLEVALRTSARSPEANDLFLNPEYNNRPTDDPTTEKRYDAEIGYTWNSRIMRFHAAFYTIRTTKATQIRRYYDDASYAFSDMVVSDIGTLHCGIEATTIFRIAYRWTVTLAASAGHDRYANNPRVTVYADNDNSVTDLRAESRMKGYILGNAPQLTGLVGVNYYGPKGWGVRIEGAYAGFRYIEPSPLRRTSRIAVQLSESAEAFDIFTRQERMRDALTLDATLFKSFYFGSSRLTLTFSVRNLPGLDDRPFSGYETHRIRRTRSADTYIYRPMDSRYLYAYPRTFYGSLSFKF